MISRPRTTARARRGHTDVTSPPDDRDRSPERLLAYTVLIRAAAAERHQRTCRWCQPGSEQFTESGFCPDGMRLAAAADAADDALAAWRAAGPAAPLPPAGLW